MLLREAASLYIASPEFRNLAFRSKRIYNNGFTSLEPLWDIHVKAITRPMVLEFRDNLYDMPGKCRVALTTLNNIMRYCFDRGLVHANPATSISGLPPSKPILRWEEAEVDLFLNTAPEYLRSAMLLALYTGQRLSDLIKMRWDDYDGKTIMVRQKKTGKELLLPVHPKLRADLDAREATAHNAAKWMPFLIYNRFGNPYTAGALGEAILRHARKIGLRRSIHGIRKTTASILAELGCSPHELMAITRHVSLKEVQRYTLEANQTKMAQAAIKKWENKDGFRI